MPSFHKTGNNRSSDEPVEELESLKHALEKVPLLLGDAKEVAISKSSSSVFSDVNGRRTGHKESQEKVTKDGQLVEKLVQKTEMNQEKEDTPARSRTETELEIPSEGIHRTFEKEEEDEGVPELDIMRKINALSGIKYTPLDMAEYVFWTGDEKGVSLAIEDFLQQGLMSRKEAINFLQSIKSNLDNIQAHYEGLRKMEEKISNKLTQQVEIDPRNNYEEKLRSSSLDSLLSKSNSYETKLMKTMAQGVLDEKKKRQEQTADDNADYEEMLDRLKGGDSLYNDYTLEEVIYELAKVMFSQSLAQGSKEAHNALRRFTDYLEKEVAYGQISRELEKKILGVIVAALSDTIGERPDLLGAASEGLSNIGGARSSYHEPKNHVLERRNLTKKAIDNVRKMKEMKSSNKN